MSKTSIIPEKGTQNIVISRIFKAPRELVFKTYIDPATVPDWWGPKRYTTTVDLMEAVHPAGCLRAIVHIQRRLS